MKIWFAKFQMDDRTPRLFEFFRAGEDRQGAFTSQLSNTRCNFSHSPKMISLCRKLQPAEAKRDAYRCAPVAFVVRDSVRTPNAARTESAAASRLSRRSFRTGRPLSDC